MPGGHQRQLDGDQTRRTLETKDAKFSSSKHQEIFLVASLAHPHFKEAIQVSALDNGLAFEKDVDLDAWAPVLCLL